MKKNILIISRAFYPNNSPRSHRSTELAKEFSRSGHNVTVATSFLSEYHEKFQQENDIKIKDLGNSVTLFEKGILSKYTPNIIKRVVIRFFNLFFNYPNIEWLFKTYNFLKREREYDLLITVAVPHPIHWGAAFARNEKRKLAKTWIADCGDPFMLQQNDSFKKMFYFKYFEKLWCRRCDFISVPFRGSKIGYYEEFHDKIKIIPQGFSFPELYGNSKDINEVPTFVYSGNIGSYRHYYKPFFELLLNTKEKFKFIIFTKEREIYENKLAPIKDKIEINDYLPRPDLLNILNQADFLIHFPYKNKIQKSLKLVDYYYVNKPILSYEGTKNNKDFKKFLIGDFKSAMLSEDIEQYRIKNVSKQFIDLMK